MEKVICAQEKTRFDRAHFKSFGDSALEFEAVYIVLDPGYGTYMDIQQAINLGLMEEFAELGVSFAFPSQTLYVASLPENISLQVQRQKPAPREPVSPQA